jgi:phospholipase/carboxylesterase
MKSLVVFFVVFAQIMSAQSVQTSLVYSVNASDGSQARPPVLILLHGYGSNENDLLDLSKAFDPGFTSIALRGPRIIAQGSYAWYDLQVGGGARVYDYAQAAKSRQLILSFISNACKTLHLDSNRVFVLGFSQGAIMSYELALSANGKIAGIVPLSGRMMDETKKLPIKWEKLADLQVFIGHGTSDNVLALEESTKAEAFLKSGKIKNIVFKTYQMAHSISGQEINDLKLWFVSALKLMSANKAK